MSKASEWATYEAERVLRIGTEAGAEIRVRVVSDWPALQYPGIQIVVTMANGAPPEHRYWDRATALSIAHWILDTFGEADTSPASAS